MRRRDFLIGTISAVSAAGAAGLVRPLSSRAVVGEGAPALRAFIVSDAHLGWYDPQQPTPEVQTNMMARIMERFPDLDVFFDTGDAHHNGRNRDRERGQWTDIIAGGCGTAPFYYIPGNHEICGVHDADPELRCNMLGSLSCRPYYSVDIKGVHFVSLPELNRAVYVTEETLQWLALDLAVHHDKTTILLSHNNITGTTGPFEEGYRGLVNSEEVLGFMTRHPNVVAWMHGHNHNYEMVVRDGKAFVSNGRIGGFDPSRKSAEGSHGLGGIYFEVRPDALEIRAYSAERGRFLDDLGLDKVSARLDIATSLDPAAPPACSFGSGGALDGQRLPVYHHHAGRGDAELFLLGAPGPVFNDDPGMMLFMSRKNKEGAHRQFMGPSVLGPNDHYEWRDPGVRLYAREDAGARAVIASPRPGYSEYVYYRCAPERTYRARITLDAHEGGQRLRLRLKVFDTEGRERADVPGPEWTLGGGTQTHEFEAALRAPGGVESIYTRPESDVLLQVGVQAEFSGLAAPVDVTGLALSIVGEGESTGNAGVAVDGELVSQAGPLDAARPARLAMPAAREARSVYEVRAGGNRRTSWLVRRSGVDWQVRNAPVADRGEYLEVGPMRNRWQETPEIVLAPMTRTADPFVHRLRHVEQARIYPINRGHRDLRLTIVKTSAPAEAVIATERKPAEVTGADEWTFENGRLRLSLTEGSDVVIRF